MVYFEFFDINAMSTCVFVQKQSFCSFVQFLQKSSSLVVTNFEDRGINLEFKPIFVADSIGQVMWTNRSPLSRRFTRLPLDAYFPDLSTLKFPKTALIRVYCVVSQYQPVYKTKPFSSLELWLKAQARKQKRSNATKNYHSQSYCKSELISCSLTSEDPKTASQMVVVSDISRSQVTSDSTAARENQEQGISQSETPIAGPVSDGLRSATVLVQSSSDLMQSWSKTCDFPATMPATRSVGSVLSKLTARSSSFLLLSTLVCASSDRLREFCSAFLWSKLAYIPSEEIPPEPPPFCACFRRFKSYLSSLLCL
jgi:hypothetical protein